jgi:peptide/nickel transport system ATP-binding protein
VTYLFISHDLAVVDLVCDEVLVLYQGRVVEQGSPQTLFTAAAHPYTRALMDAVPQARPGALRRPRIVPMAVEPRYEQAGACPFAPRCRWRQAACADAAPALRLLGPGHQVACHRAEQVLGSGAPLAAESPEP